MARKCNLTTSLIRKWWADFNDKYFAGILHAPTNIEITKSTRCLGQFAATTNWFCSITTIRISNYYDRDERGFQETLIHEMIHQWQYEKHLPIDHKTHFKQMANRINAMGGWNISRTTNIEDGVAEGIKERKSAHKSNAPVYLVKFTRNGQTPAFAFATTNLWKKVVKSPVSVSRLKTDKYWGGDMEVYYIANRPDSCSCFLVNRARLKNYDLAPHADIINPVVQAAQRVAF